MSGNALVSRSVARMNGAGNKILVLDLRDGAPLPTPEEARAIHLGPGLDYDQMMVLSRARTSGSLAYVSIYNNDGSLSETCGNGARCVADRLARETGTREFWIETAAGPIACERVGGSTYRVDMGAPRFGWREIPLSHEVRDTDAVSIPFEDAPDLGLASVVNIGNPHVVFFVSDVASIALESLGPRYENDPMFPQRTNVSFAQILARDKVKLRVWERGVGATLACGSAACATLVTAVRRGLTDPRARIAPPGGQLTVEWRKSDSHVLMTGPVEFEREIVLEAWLFTA